VSRVANERVRALGVDPDEVDREALGLKQPAVDEVHGADVIAPGAPAVGIQQPLAAQRRTDANGRS